MKKIKQILFGAVIAIMIIEITVFTGNTICYAADENPTVGENLTVGEVYDTALEFAYGDTFRSVYENRLAGSPLETEGADGVDTATGHLMLSRTDLSLDGTGGMDFELNRYYDSNEANLGHAMVEHVDELKRDTIWVEYTAEDGAKRKLVVNAALLSNHKDALKNLIGSSYKKGEVQHKDVIRPEGGTQRTKIVSNERHNVYGVASGWRYDFPWIETVILTEDEGWGKIPAYLHFGSAGVASISYKADNDSKTYQITGLEDYDYQDIRLEDFEQTVNGVACRYLLRDKTGLRTYFNEDGVIVLQKDAHNNTISYTYTDGIYFSKITDSVGREILFHYDDEEGEKVLASVTVQGRETEGGVAKQTVTYETDRKSYTPLHGDRLHGFILTAAVVDGRKEKYGYKTVERLVSTAGEGAASQRVSTNQSYLLTKITADGCEQYYEYRGCSLRGTKRYGTGQKRDVVTGQFYVTREYQKDLKTGKKSEGIKYDYFQRQDDTLISFADFEEGKNEVWQYGKSGLKTAALVSTFNPNKYKTNKKYYDYKYKKSKINAGTLRLKKDTKKNASLYIYNENKQLAEQVEYGQEKQETLYRYDKDGKGSLVVQETSKSYGKKGSGAMVSNQGYTYDVYRNLLTSKSPRAYLKKNKGKEHLFTTTYNYHATDKGYPAGDAAAVLSTLESQENYSSAGTKVRMTGVIASNGMDIISIFGQKSVGGGAYQTISKTDFSYDAHGNEIQGKVYPAYSTDGEAEMIQNDYTYNELGQQTKRTVAISSAKRPADSRTYTEEEITYDSFGNELTYTDANGLVSKTTYDPKTGEETETINAVGTEYESADKEYQSSDGLKTMTVDNYGRVTITIQDAFGNTLISKDEAAGTWTESVYEYGSTEGDGDTEDDEEKEEVTRLVEERTYVFEPDEKRFIINEDGETVPNYYITGKGKEILSGSRYFYDALGNQTGSASFCNGELDAAHCSGWSFSKSESEVTGEGDETRTISTSYQKELNPSAYQPDADPENYYDQFNDAALSESISETVMDAEGNTLSATSIIIRGGNRQETVTTYETDDFGRTVNEDTVTRKYQDGKWLPFYETQTFFTYDDNGNVSQSETRSRKEGETEWQSKTVKTDYDEQGQVTKEYTPRGMKENVAAKYEYDILGRMVRSEIPQEKKDGSIKYQKNMMVYDNTGNVTEKSGQIDGDRTAKTEYTYDKHGNLVMVKSCLEDGKGPNGSSAQYVQYVYDTEGNKVRQFTGMTAPLTLEVSELSAGAGKEGDTFSYAGKKYQIHISGKKKGDTIHETKYEYNGKNQLTAYFDPEGRKETYTYDVNGNLTKTIDKNGNTMKNTYDYQNRLTETVAAHAQKGKETKHTYTYNVYGEVATQDGTAFSHADVSGQVTKEITKLTKNKAIEKSYTYDSADNKSAFGVKVGGDTKLSLRYTYDGESRLTSVTDEKGNEVVGYSYDTDGNLSGRTVPGNGLVTTYNYDYQNHLTGMKNQTGSVGVISEYTSKYLINGQKSEESSGIVDKKGKKSTKTVAYTYDLMGRITKETKTGSQDISYTYDSNNNRKEMAVGNQVTAYKYNKNDELLRTDTLDKGTEEDSVVIYKNDKNGNQLATVNRYEIPEEKKDKVYIDIDVTLGDNRLNDNVVNHFNALDQLTSTLTKNYKVSFTYDAEGLRTSKTVNGEKTVFVWDGDQVVMELSGGGKVQKRYVRGNDLVFVDKGEGSEKQYYVADPHGNVVQLTDENGKVIKNYEYDSFGNEVKPDKKDDNPFRYCGEYYDKETGEVYLRARYYQPGTGRFLTRDTYTGESDDPESLHLYTYCGNDGVNVWDPSGHWGKFSPTENSDVSNYQFVHQQLTVEALMQLSFSNSNLAFTSLDFCRGMGLSKKELGYILDGSILPDYLKKKPNKNNEWNTKGKIIENIRTKKKILGMNLKDDNTFHGKNKKKLENLMENADETFKKKGSKRKKLILLGCVLHSIQDYQAHSFKGDLESVKKNFKKGNYVYLPEVLIYNKDWLKYYLSIQGERQEKKIDVKGSEDLEDDREREHHNYKDNPYMDFVKCKNTELWMWDKVSSPSSNGRYIQARKDSVGYLNKALKQISRWG